MLLGNFSYVMDQNGFFCETKLLFYIVRHEAK